MYYIHYVYATAAVALAPVPSLPSPKYENYTLSERTKMNEIERE